MSARRLPGRIRRAVTQLEDAYVTGTDTEYQEALADLGRLAGTLDDRGRATLNERLATAHARAHAARFAATVRQTLTEGEHRIVTTLDGLEVIEVSSPTFQQLLITVPIPLPDDTAQVRARVAQAREALLAGRCPTCSATITLALGDQLTLNHRPRCPLSEQALIAARRR